MVLVKFKINDMKQSTTKKTTIQKICHCPKICAVFKEFLSFLPILVTPITVIFAGADYYRHEIFHFVKIYCFTVRIEIFAAHRVAHFPIYYLFCVCLWPGLPFVDCFNRPFPFHSNLAWICRLILKCAKKSIEFRASMREKKVKINQQKTNSWS